MLRLHSSIQTTYTLKRRIRLCLSHHLRKHLALEILLLD
ncbi:hypothetical protein PRSM4_005 [Prochlorococcus phage P-RSM4]|uniref:Uncharacterized protein n=1 Tax=Prochlorococcus phage P-RSM4 TaxID=444862 RepID=E3SLP2_9CAUD|nr:hypothetical protein PRSM4_005 [Prochlorococcus phage P-RSM4]ADO98390.1 hypothetical protein PRSM4_005 [Prochlorococcus phage P-RSM4]